MNIAPLYDISPELIIKGAVVFLNTDFFFFLLSFTVKGKLLLSNDIFTSDKTWQHNGMWYSGL